MRIESASKVVKRMVSVPGHYVLRKVFIPTQPVDGETHELEMVSPHDVIATIHNNPGLRALVGPELFEDFLRDSNLSPAEQKVWRMWGCNLRNTAPGKTFLTPNLIAATLDLIAGAPKPTASPGEPPSESAELTRLKNLKKDWEKKTYALRRQLLQAGIKPKF